jgi:two-component system, sensor histidine kinase and response regulator
MPLTSAHPQGWRAFGVGAVAVVAATVLFALIVGLPLGSPRFVTALDDMGEAVAALVAAGACALTASRSEGQFRRAWLLLGASAASWGLGQSVWTVDEVVLGVAPFPSLADLGFLAAIPLAIAGLLSFWTAPRGTAEHWHLWLDGLNIVLGLTFTGWALGLHDVWLSGGSLAERAIGLAYPVGDILIATVLILGIRRATRYQHARMLLLLAGLGAISFSDSAFAYMTTSGTYQNVFDTGWVFGYLMIALAALWPARANDRVADRLPIDLWQIALPWTVVVAAATTALVVVLRGGRTDNFQTELAVAMAALLIVSEVLTHIDSLSMVVASRRSEAIMAEVIAQAPIGIARADRTFKIVDANPGLTQLLGDPADVMVGSTIAKYLRTDDRALVYEKIGALMSESVASIQADNLMIRADATEVWVHWTSTAVKNSEGEVEYFLTTLEDVTATHEAEESSEANLVMLEKLNALKSEFLQGVTFEFKTALMEISGSSELIRDGSNLDAAEVKALAGDIFKNGARLDHMITEMLDLDRIETGRGSLSIGPIDLNAIIAHEVQAARANLDGALLSVNLRASLPAVAGDAIKLSEVVRTLLRNAIKYSPDGGLIVVATGMRDDQVEVSVKDEGLAVRADFDNRLFGDGDLYTNNPIRKVVGTGLGLGIARQIVEMHGGQIAVDHLEGVGSISRFSIPVAKSLSARSLVTELAVAGVVA